jgi:hypothetical protein
MTKTTDMRPFIFERIVAVQLTFVTILFFANPLQAQKPTVPNETMMTDVGGAPIYLKTEYIIDGSPYFPPEHTSTTIVLKSGKIYPTVKSRLNLYDNILIILRDDGAEQMLTGSISKVIYESVPAGKGSRTVVFQTGFPAIDGHDNTTYYEVLDSGKLKLIKHSKVSYSDKRGYGEASITRVFKNLETYYLVLPGNIIRQMGKGKEEFLAALPGKKNELEKYIDNKKIKCKKEEDWIELVSYYNSVEK